MKHLLQRLKEIAMAPTRLYRFLEDTPLSKEDKKKYSIGRYLLIIPFAALLYPVIALQRKVPLVVSMILLLLVFLFYWYLNELYLKYLERHIR